MTVTFQVSKWPPITTLGTLMVQQLGTILVHILLVYRQWIIRAISNDDSEVSIYIVNVVNILCVSLVHRYQRSRDTTHQRLTM